MWPWSSFPKIYVGVREYRILRRREVVMEFVCEPGKQVPVIGDYDVVVGALRRAKNRKKCQV